MKNATILRLSAISLALCFTTGGAWAATTTVTGSGVTLLSGANLTVTDTSNNSVATTKTQASTGTLAQFNSSLGVLTSASATLIMPVSGTSLTQSGNAGSTSVTTTWSLGGNSSPVSTLNSTTSNTSDTSWNNVSLSSSAANLNNFVGAGDIATDGFSTVIGANLTQNGSNKSTTAVSQSLIGSQSIVYTYTAHSNASFTSVVDTNSLSYNFGLLNAGVGASQAFSIYGLAGGLGLTNYTVGFLSGNNVFNVTGSSSIGAGASGNYNAIFNAQNPGVLTNYSGVYRLTFSDDVSGLGTYASNSVGSNYIDLTLVATTVPEAGNYGMFLAGLGLIGFFVRRRQRS